MADDPEFKRDVLDQKVKKILHKAGIRKELVIFNDVFRWEGGPKYSNEFPTVLCFNNW